MVNLKEVKAPIDVTTMTLSRKDARLCAIEEDGFLTSSLQNAQNMFSQVINANRQI